jgi:hypothetical protein
MTFNNENFYGSAQSDYRTVHGKNVEGWTATDDKATKYNLRISLMGRANKKASM